MKKFGLASISLYALMLALPAHAESLSEAAQTAVTSHPSVSEVVNDRHAVTEELEQAKGLYRPQIDLRGDLGLGWSNRWGQGTGASAVDDGDWLGNAAAQISLSQLLFDGYNTKNEIKKQQNRIVSASQRVREASELAALNATESYLNVLRERQLAELAQQNLADHRAMQADIERRTHGGAGTRGDVEQAQARVSQAEAVLAQVQGDLRDAEAQYNSTVGHFPEDLQRPQTPMEYMPATENDAVAVALSDSPTVDVHAADVDVSNTELEQTKSAFYPTVNLESSASRQKDLGGVRTTKDEVGAGVVMRWNIYRGGADKAREREFTWRQAEANDKLNVAKREAEERMRRAWAARDTARTRAEHYARQVRANENVVQVYKKQFQAGDRTLLDVLDSQNELFLSRSNMLNAYYTALFGDYQVLAERGAMLASLGVQAPEMAMVKSEQPAAQ